MEVVKNFFSSILRVCEGAEHQQLIEVPPRSPPQTGVGSCGAAAAARPGARGEEAGSVGLDRCGLSSGEPHGRSLQQAAPSSYSSAFSLFFSLCVPELARAAAIGSGAGLRHSRRFPGRDGGNGRNRGSSQGVVRGVVLEPRMTEKREAGDYFPALVSRDFAGGI